MLTTIEERELRLRKIELAIELQTKAYDRGIIRKEEYERHLIQALKAIENIWGASASLFFFAYFTALFMTIVSFLKGEKMLEKFKEWYYKYGLLACAGKEEEDAALKAINEADAKLIPENKFIYKIIYKVFYRYSVYYGFVNKVYVYRAANRKKAFEIADNYIKYTNGFYMCQNVNRPMSVEDES